MLVQRKRNKPMCLEPVIRNGLKFRCHKCKTCKLERVFAWTGRCLAESKTSDTTMSVTLTYGVDRQFKSADHLKARKLFYSDMQAYFRSLRDHGYKFRYLCAGEYGTEKGRAHWHVVFFFDGKVPPHRIEENFNHHLWPHGFQFWKPGHQYSVAYVCKYITDPEKNLGSRPVFQMSRKPALGARYFEHRAQQFVDAGLSPQNGLYKFADSLDQHGKPVIYRLRDAPLRAFLDAFMERWRIKYGNDNWPYSQFLTDWQEYKERAEEWKSWRPNAKSNHTVAKMQPRNTYHSVTASKSTRSGTVASTPVIPLHSANKGATFRRTRATIQNGVR